MSHESTAMGNGRAHLLADAAGIASCLRTHRQFVMCAHEKPDGDVLGSGYALGMALKSLGKDVAYFLDPETAEGDARAFRVLRDELMMKAA